jgi:hypothetical protein
LHTKRESKSIEKGYIYVLDRKEKSCETLDLNGLMLEPMA